MRNLFILLIAIAFSVISCKQEPKPSAADVLPQKALSIPFAVDSIKVHDSLKINKNLTVRFQSQLLVFPSLNNSTLLDSIYKPEKIALTNYSKDSLQHSLGQKMEDYFAEQKSLIADYTPTFSHTWYTSKKMQIKDNQFGFLTIKYTGDGYTGGAHGYYDENYKVFDLKNKTTVQLQDVVKNHDSVIWNRLLMDTFLTNDLEKGQSKMLLVKKIPLTKNFYFDGKNLYFLYNQYEITAYAAGPVLIKVPFTKIKPLLSSSFKARIGL